VELGGHLVKGAVLVAGAVLELLSTDKSRPISITPQR
jgi:riboflavin synthase alpha subunit